MIFNWEHMTVMLSFPSGALSPWGLADAPNVGCCMYSGWMGKKWKQHLHYSVMQFDTFNPATITLCVKFVLRLCQRGLVTIQYKLLKLFELQCSISGGHNGMKILKYISMQHNTKYSLKIIIKLSAVWQSQQNVRISLTEVYCSCMN